MSNPIVNALEAAIAEAVVRIVEYATKQPDLLAAARAAARTEAHRIAFEHAAALALDAQKRAERALRPK